MVGNLYYKKYIDKLINSNPTDIEIKRISKVDNGYGGYTTTEVVINETVTFYNRRAVGEVISDSGISFKGVNIAKMLSTGDADIIKGDTFILDNLEYRVLFANAYFDICKQIELEVIK